MYGYYKYIPLEKEEILKYITQEDIFKLVFKVAIQEGMKITSPFRIDRNPGCKFKYAESGILYFIDYAEEGNKIYRNCFDAVSEFYNLSFRDTLGFIIKEINLNNSEHKLVKHKRKIINIDKSKIHKDIKIYKRDFDKKDRLFWSSYGISLEDLYEDKVFPIKYFRTKNSKNETFTVNLLKNSYAFTDFKSKNIKIYTPEGSKFNKWYTNCTSDDIGGIDKIENTGDKLIITKSYKDYRVLKNNDVKNVIWLQSETVILKQEIILELSSRFKEIVILFDNDNTGINNSQIMSMIFNFHNKDKSRCVYVPNYINIKDPSDLYKYRGKLTLRKFLKENNIT